MELRKTAEGMVSQIIGIVLCLKNVRYGISAEQRQFAQVRHCDKARQLDLDRCPGEQRPTREISYKLSIGRTPGLVDLFIELHRTSKHL